MSAPPILALRQEVVTHLKADVAVTTVLPDGQIYGEESDPETAWPFSRIGELEGLPGHEVFGAVHVFSKAKFTDEVNLIAERIGTSLDDAVIELPDTRKAILILTRIRTLPDGEVKGAWHSIVSFQATIAKECIG